MIRTKPKGFVPELFQYATWNILGSLGYAAYIFLDTFFMAKGVGANGLTALNLVLPGCSLVLALAMMLGVGASTKFAILQAQGESRRANEIFTTAVGAGVVIGLVFAIIGIFFSDKVVSLLGADQEILPLAATYLRTFFCFSAAFLLNGIVTGFVRCDGAPKLAMAAMLTGSAVNTLLDVILIFGFGWGIFGAAFSSGLAPVISLLVLSQHRRIGNNGFHLVKFKYQSALLRQICVLGTSSFVSELSSGVIIIVFNVVILNISGNLGVAAYGIVANLALIAAAVFQGLTNGVQPLISRAHGTGKQHQIRQGFLFLSCGAVILGLLFYLSGLLFSAEIAAVFDRDNNVPLIAMGADGIRVYFSAFLAMGCNIAVAGFLTAKEQPKPAFLIALLRGGLLVVPVVPVMAYLWQMTGVWLAVPVTEVLTLTVTGGILWMQHKKTKCR